jgi:hypothetical protein
LTLDPLDSADLDDKPATIAEAFHMTSPSRIGRLQGTPQ